MRTDQSLSVRAVGAEPERGRCSGSPHRRALRGRDGARQRRSEPHADWGGWVTCAPPAAFVFDSV